MIPKHLLINFDELKVGQRVWCAQQGYVTVRDITDSERYPIAVYSSESNKEIRFSRDGHWLRSDLLPTLFLDCPFIEEERVVEVSNYEDFNPTQKRVLHTIKNGKFLCWSFAQNIEDSKDKCGLTPFPFMREVNHEPEPIKENIESPKSVTMQDYILLKEINWFGKETIPSGTVYKQVDADAYWPVINGAEKPWMKVDFHTVKNNSEYFLEIKK